MVVFFVAVPFFTTGTEVVPSKRPGTNLGGCLTGMDDPQDGSSESRRGYEGWGYVVVAVVTVFLCVIVGAQNVCDVTGGWDTDWSMCRHLPCKICSFFHSLTIFLHSGLPSFVLVFKEVGRNPTTFGLNELSEDAGNGIILGIVEGEDGIVNVG